MFTRNLRFLTPLSRGFSTTSFPAAIVGELRKKSGASIGLCREALVTENGDIEKALNWLRKKGIDTSAKRGARDATNGVLAVNVSSDGIALIELNCETDFVARNESFITLATDLSKAVTPGTLDVKAEPFSRISIADASAQVTNCSATLGEKISLAKAVYIPTPAQGAKGVYLHQAQGCTAQKVGVITLKSAAPKDQLEAFAELLAMQAVSSGPKFYSSLPEDVAAAEKNVAEGLAEEKFGPLSEKTKVAREKFVEGQLTRLTKQECFLSQEWFMGELCEQKGLPKVEAKLVGDAIRTFEKLVKQEVIVGNVVVVGVGAPKPLFH